MEIKHIKEHENTLQMVVTDTDISFMNAIRRAVMNWVPVLAIENLRIYENSSVLFDEFLGHRLAMIPLKADIDDLPKSGSVKLVLEKEGPGMVYSKDIKSTDPKVDVAEKKIPIVLLKNNQKIKIEMDAVVGFGKEHAKWQPALITYHEMAKISITKDCNLCEKCVKNCAKQILSVKGNKIIVGGLIECNLCGKCREVCKNGALKLDYDPTTFVVKMEGYGVMSNREALLRAVKALQAKNQAFREAVNDL